MRPDRRILFVAIVALFAMGGGAIALSLLRTAITGDNVPTLGFASPTPGASATSGSTAGSTAGSTPAGSTGPVTAAGLAGTWSIGSGTEVGYRVLERLNDRNADSDAVGRTSKVTGSATIQAAGDSVRLTTASFEADLATLVSDSSMRDGQLGRQGIQTDQFPTGTFKTTAAIDVPATAIAGAEVDVTLVGDMTLHGVTKSVQIAAKAQVIDGAIQVVGAYSFGWGDFGMTAPESFRVLTVAETATMEFRIVLAKG